MSKPRIGNYEILGLIDKGGGQARVHKARCVTEVVPGVAVGELVALKRLHHMTDEIEVTRFERESKILRKLDHPNIVRYKDSFVWPDEFGEERGCVVMELLEGKTLRALLKREPNGLPWEQVESILGQVLKAVQYASLHRVIHRDLKPSNIFITTDGLAKLIDFGIARHQSGDETATATGASFIGTLDYMAPDFVRLEPQGQKNFRGDERSDIFSFGVCLYQALTGQLPLAPLSDTMQYHVRWMGKQPPNVDYRHFSFRVLQGSRSCVAKCLAPDRAARYRSFDEVVSDFAGISRKKVKHGAYEYLEYLGKGGFGEVFRARRIRDGCEVAIKHLFPRHDAKKFRKEAQILRDAAHPHLVEYLDLVVERDLHDEAHEWQHYLVLEYLKGMPDAGLNRRISASGSGLDPIEAVRLFIGYLDCLEHLHRRQIIHRDIKPENLYALEGDPDSGKIFDLGVAHDAEGSLTAGGVTGTLNYIAPEFAFEETKHGLPQSDIYSTGVSLYQTLTAKLPLPRLPGDTALMRYVLRSRSQIKCPLDKAAIKETCTVGCCAEQTSCPFEHPVFEEHPDLAPIIRRALARHPSMRYGSAGEMRDELQRVLKSWMRQTGAPVVSPAKRADAASTPVSWGAPKQPVLEKSGEEQTETDTGPVLKDRKRPEIARRVADSRRIKPDEAATGPTTPADVEKVRREMEEAEEAEGGEKPAAGKLAQVEQMGLPSESIPTTPVKGATEPTTPAALGKIGQEQEEAEKGKQEKGRKFFVRMPLMVRRVALSFAAMVLIGIAGWYVNDKLSTTSGSQELAQARQFVSDYAQPAADSFPLDRWDKLIKLADAKVRAKGSDAGEWQTVLDKIGAIGPLFHSALTNAFAAAISRKDIDVAEALQNKAKEAQRFAFSLRVAPTKYREVAKKMREEIEILSLVSVAVTSDPAGAEVSSQGIDMGRTPINTNWPVGTYVLLAKYLPLADQSHTLELKPGQGGEVKFDFPHGAVTLDSDPPGAKVLVAGKEVGRTPYDDKIVKPGEVVYQLDLAGCQVTNVSARVMEKTRLPLHVMLTRMTEGVQLTSNPDGATVFLDGKELGTTPTGLMQLPTGRQTLIARYSGLEVTNVVEVKAGESLRSDFKFPHGGVRIESDFAGAEVVVDGKVVGTTPYENRFVPVGQLVAYEVRKGSLSKKLTLQVSDGQTVSKNVVLSSGKGTLLVSSDPPGTEIYWRNQLLGKTGATPLQSQPIDKGSQTLTARHPVLGDQEITVLVKADAETTANVAFEYGSLVVRAEPTNVVAQVFDGEKRLGSTPYRVQMVKAGPVKYSVRAEDYVDQTVEGEIVEKQVNELTAKLELGKGTLDLAGTTGAEVFLDRNRLGKLPLPKNYQVVVGVHSLEVKYAGLEPQVKQIQVKKGQTVSEKFEFKYGSVVLTSKPTGAQVWVDDERVGTTPYTNNVIRPGPVAYTLQSAGYEDFVVRTNVMANVRLPVSVTLTRAVENVKFTSDPDGATVFSEGKELGKTPLSVKLLPGRLEFAARYPGLSNVTRSVEVKRSQSSNAHFVFSYGGLEITSDQTNAQVSLNGKPVGPTPYTNRAVAPGPLTCMVKAGKLSKTLTLRVSASQTLTNNVVLSSGKGTLLLTSDPPEVEVFWRGQSLGKTTAATPLRTIPIDQGTQTLVARHPVLGEQEVAVLVKADAEVEVKVPRFAYGSVWVKANPDSVEAKVYREGKELGPTPYFDPVVKRGEVKYEVRATGYETNHVAKSVVDGKTIELLAMLKKIEKREGIMTNSIGMELVKVRGLPGISGDCWVGAYEVTQGEYEKVMEKNPVMEMKPSPEKFMGDRMPVVNVSFDDAAEFCAKLTQKDAATTGIRYQLPTEKQWRYLATKGETRLEDSVTSKERVEKKEPSRSQPEVVGSTHKPNKFGLFDIRGNVCEWRDTPGEKERWLGGSYQDAFESEMIPGRPGTLSIEFPGDPKTERTDRLKFVGFRVLGVGSASR